MVVNPENDWATCLTVEQLKAIWEPGSTVDNWQDVDPSFPDEPLLLYGPGTDSGTFDYFTDVIVGEEGESRTDFQASEDDNVIIEGVTGDTGALGYFGFSYYEQNQDKREGRGGRQRLGLRRSVGGRPRRTGRTRRSRVRCSCTRRRAPSSAPRSPSSSTT